MSDDRQPEFGPGGYLPERAARRARKIILREQMGAGWPLAAIAAGVVLLVVGAVFLLTRAAAPQPPFEPVTALEAIDPRGLDRFSVAGVEVLVVRAGGGVRAFEAPDVEVTYCEANRRLEAAGGEVWNLAGRRTGGAAASLRPLPTEVHDGTVYVHPLVATEALPPVEGDEAPACS